MTRTAPATETARGFAEGFSHGFWASFVAVAGFFVTILLVTHR